MRARAVRSPPSSSRPSSGVAPSLSALAADPTLPYAANRNSREAGISSTTTADKRPTSDSGDRREGGLSAGEVRHTCGDAGGRRTDGAPCGARTEPGARCSYHPRPELEVELVAIEELRAHPRNYRRHPEDQREHIRRSIREHGFYRNVVVARDGTILAGHGVVESAADDGYEEIPVVRLDLDPEDPRAIKVLTGDNEIARLAEIDDRRLTELLRDISEAPGTELVGSGFDEEKLAALRFVTRPPEEIEEVDEDAEWVGMPSFEPATDPPRVIVSFRSEEDRARFMEKYDELDYRTRNRGKTITAWWPARPLRDLSSVRFEQDPDEAEPAA